MREPLPARANVRLRTVRREGVRRGEVTGEVCVHNLRLTAGWRAVLDAGSPKSLKDFSYVAVGTGSTAPSAGDTALVAEIARGNGAATNPTPDTLRFDVTIPAGTASGTVTETLLDSDAAPTGAPLARALISPGLAWASSDDLVGDWELT